MSDFSPDDTWERIAQGYMKLVHKPLKTKAEDFDAEQE